MKSIRHIFDIAQMKRTLRTFRRDPLLFVKSRISSTWYDIRCFFFPYNVVKCNHLHRSWNDRDELMFHAMFQIIVDFVELEQEFRDWDDKYTSKRYKDRAAMHAWIERHFNTEEGRQSWYWEGISEEEKAKMDKQTQHRYQINKEIMYLYEWYVDKRYELDSFGLQEQTGTRLKIIDGHITRVPNGKPALLTMDEVMEMEQEHDAVCNRMLERILVVREYLWT